MRSEYAKSTYSAKTPTVDVARESCSTYDKSVDGWFEKLNRTTIGGEEAYYASQLRCLDDSSSSDKVVYLWEIPSRDLLVIAYDTPIGKTALGDINAVLNNIEWK